MAAFSLTLELVHPPPMDVILHFSKSVLMKKQTHLEWHEAENIFLLFFFFCVDYSFKLSIKKILKLRFPQKYEVAKLFSILIIIIIIIIIINVS